MTRASFNRKRALQAVVRVGGGRGFIVETVETRKARGAQRFVMRDRFIVTASHCLPHFPPRHSGAANDELTYKKLVGALGDKRPSIWTECAFADPRRDVAVLGNVDSNELDQQWRDYLEFTDGIEPLAVCDQAEGDAFLLSLGNEWFPCKVQSIGEGMYYVTDAKKGIIGGMSGSPILSPDGRAIGIVTISGGGPGEVHTTGPGNARLATDLPGWMLRGVGLVKPGRNRS